MTPDNKPKKTPAVKPPAPCAICGKPVNPDCKPFCSRRCANVDLHRWLSNSYSIAGAPQEDDWDGDPETDSSEQD